MKKIIIAAFALVACFISLTSFAYTPCTVGQTSTFCNCIISDCEGTFPPGACTYANLKESIESMGIETTCELQNEQYNTPVAQCVTGLNSFLYNTPPEDPESCKSYLP